MATIDIARTYVDGEVLFASDLDTIIDTVEYFLNTTKLTDDNIANGSITGSLKLVNASVTNAKMATDSVATSNIEDAAVTAAKINTSAVTTDKINNAAVTNAKLANDSIDSANIINGSVTRVKLAAPNYVISSSGSGFFSTTSTTAVAVTNLTVTLTLTGRPVLIQLIPDNSATSDGTYPAFVGVQPNSPAGTTGEAIFYLYKDSSLFSTVSFKKTNESTYSGSMYLSPGCVSFIDSSASTGSSTYAVYSAVSSASSRCQHCKLIAIEL